MKALILATTALTMLSLGCSKEEQHPSVVPDTKFSASVVTTTNYLIFEITLTRPLSQGRTLIIKAQSWPWLSMEQLSFYDELKQGDGKEVSFDCDAIAEKIIDAKLVEEITPLCKWGHDWGTQYWKDHNYSPDEFTDSTGQKWKKAQ